MASESSASLTHDEDGPGYSHASTFISRANANPLFSRAKKVVDEAKEFGKESAPKAMIFASDVVSMTVGTAGSLGKKGFGEVTDAVSNIADALQGDNEDEEVMDAIAAIHQGTDAVSPDDKNLKKELKRMRKQSIPVNTSFTNIQASQRVQVISVRDLAGARTKSVRKGPKTSVRFHLHSEAIWLSALSRYQIPAAVIAVSFLVGVPLFFGLSISMLIAAVKLSMISIIALMMVDVASGKARFIKHTGEKMDVCLRGAAVIEEDPSIQRLVEERAEELLQRMKEGMRDTMDRVM